MEALKMSKATKQIHTNACDYQIAISFMPLSPTHLGKRCIIVERWYELELGTTRVGQSMK